ncbi:hypothetical protein [Actinoallomurus acaciae]|uniref:Uncharacterized protein n=1 Tax=Actinoallomurus acaciae TaxID=502577 RepID=A0ABV5Z004_9ACTN
MRWLYTATVFARVFVVQTVSCSSSTATPYTASTSPVAGSVTGGV